jgi:hypothetical protein
MAGTHRGRVSNSHKLSWFVARSERLVQKLSEEKGRLTPRTRLSKPGPTPRRHCERNTFSEYNKKKRVLSSSYSALTSARPHLIARPGGKTWTDSTPRRETETESGVVPFCASALSNATCRLRISTIPRIARSLSFERSPFHLVKSFTVLLTLQQRAKEPGHLGIPLGLPV